MKSHDRYSNALRSIGQVLGKWGINAFELTCFGSEFRLQCGDPTPPYLTLMKLRYTDDDIRSLERKGRARRGVSVTTTEQDGPAAILRALGGYVDDEGGNLVRICNSAASLEDGLIRLEYRSRDGQIRRKDVSLISIHEYSERMYGDRSPNSRNVIRSA
jgi:hypothetical protein